MTDVDYEQLGQLLGADGSDGPGLRRAFRDLMTDMYRPEENTVEFYTGTLSSPLAVPNASFVHLPVSHLYETGFIYDDIGATKSDDYLGSSGQLGAECTFALREGLWIVNASVSWDADTTGFRLVYPVERTWPYPYTDEEDPYLYNAAYFPGFENYYQRPATALAGSTSNPHSVSSVFLHIRREEIDHRCTVTVYQNSGAERTILRWDVVIMRVR